MVRKYAGFQLQNPQGTSRPRLCSWSKEQDSTITWFFFFSGSLGSLGEYYKQTYALTLFYDWKNPISTKPLSNPFKQEDWPMCWQFLSPPTFLSMWKASIIGIKCAGTGAILHGSESYFFPLVAVWLWETYLNSIYLTFHISKMGILIVPASWGDLQD